MGSGLFSWKPFVAVIAFKRWVFSVGRIRPTVVYLIQQRL